MKKLLLSLATCSLLVSVLAQTNRIDRKVDSVLRLMTLEEKIGQLNQYNGDWEATGPITKAGDKQEQIIAWAALTICFILFELRFKPSEKG